MKESKYSIYVLGSILFINLIIIIYVDQNNVFYNIFSASFGGVAVSWVVAIITYLTEKRKLVYNFYNAAERYAENINYFSKLIIETNAMMKDGKFQDGIYMNYIFEKVEKLYTDLYNDFSIIQEETRKIESSSLKRNIHEVGFYMRKFYKAIKDDMKVLKSCLEILKYEKIKFDGDIKTLKTVYDSIFSIFKIQLKEDTFELIKCKELYDILDNINNRYNILSQVQDGVCREIDYRLKYTKKSCTEIVNNKSEENGDVNVIFEILKSLMPKEISTKY